MSTAASMGAGLFIAHHHPGRLRVRTEAFLGEGPAAERTKTGLAQTPGVLSAIHDPRTGSLLVKYEPRDLDVNRLITRIGELSGLSCVTTSARTPAGTAAHIVTAVRKVDQLTESLTGGRLSLGELVPASLVAFGVYSFFKSSHARVPRWDSLIYWAYSVFVHTHSDAVRPSP
jgi:hypothetical protein